MNTASFLRALAGAPAHSNQSPADLVGWRLHDRAFACASCMARVIARGCGSSALTPVWDPRPVGLHCVGCEATKTPREMGDLLCPRCGAVYSCPPGCGYTVGRCADCGVATVRR